MLAEARWLAEQGVRELVLVSENSTSYGKDLGDLRLLETLLPELAAVDGHRRVRVSYLQPAEMRPGLMAAMTSTPGVAPYFDLSFQHPAPRCCAGCAASATPTASSSCSSSVRAAAPEAGLRSNFIVGFPGETEDDLAELERFLTEARLDAIGVFGYSDEDGTEAATYDGKLAGRGRARAGGAGHAGSPRSWSPSAPRSGSARSSRCWSRSVDTAAGTAPRAARPTRARRSTASRPLLDAGHLVVGAMVVATVVGSEGADLVARSRVSGDPGRDAPPPAGRACGTSPTP